MFKIYYILLFFIFFIGCNSQNVTQSVSVTVDKNLLNSLDNSNEQKNIDKTQTSAKDITPVESSKNTVPANIIQTPVPAVIQTTKPTPTVAVARFESKAPQEGERIVFSLSNGRFYAMKSDGSQLDALTPSSVKFSNQAKLSPNGKFAYDYDSSTSSLIVYHLNGDVYKKWKLPGAIAYKWSPDGSKILLYDLTTFFPMVVDIHVEDQVFQIGKQFRRADASSERQPLLIWSSDSRKISFVSSDGFVYVYSVPDRQLGAPLNQTALKNLNLKDIGWSASNQYLSLLQTKDNSHYQVVVLPIDGRGEYILSDSDGFQVWSDFPNGNLLAVSNQNIYMFDIGKGDTPLYSLTTSRLVDSMGWLYNQTFSYIIGIEAFVVNQDTHTPTKLPLESFLSLGKGLSNYSRSPDREAFIFSSNGKIIKVNSAQEVREIANLSGTINNLVWAN